MVLGIIVVLVVGNFVVNYIRAKRVDNLPAASTQAMSENTYEVQKGESLWSIAEDNYNDGYKWQEIAKANDLTDYSLEIGQKLVIPELSSDTAMMQEPEQYAQSDNTIASDTYTVEKGDSLWKIAIRTYGDGYQWVKIAKANNLANPDIIHVGNVLTLPQ